MKVVSYSYPRSDFLSVEKDLHLIVTKMLSNERLKKLLYYDTKDALSRPNLTEEQTLSLIDHQIKIYPKMTVDKPEYCYIYIHFSDFTPNDTNPAYRDNNITIQVVCHFNQYNLGDFQLRPFKIAAEIDSMLNNQRLTGIGKTEFWYSSHKVMSDEFGSLLLQYRVIHGNEGEDSTNPLKPSEVPDIVENYNKVFNRPDNAL